MVCTADDTVHFYDIESDASIKSLKFANHQVSHIAWNPHRQGELICNVRVGMYVCDMNKETLKKMAFSPPSRTTAFAQHPLLPNLLACGTVEGGVWLSKTDGGSANHRLSQRYETAIADISFDPKSEDYVLVATTGGRVALWTLQGAFDAGKNAVKPFLVMEFQKQQNGLTAAKFIDGMPGTFVTASDRHGVVRVWNVSNAAPLHSIKTDHGPVSSIASLQNETKAAVSFASGHVAVLDVKDHRVQWSNDGGHTETIFDCHLSEENPHTLVTCSFDGTVRRWDTRTKKGIQTFKTTDARSKDSALGGGDIKNDHGGKGALYSCAISCDGSIVCASGFEGKLYFFDVKTGRTLPSIHAHDLSVHRIAAHPKEGGLFAAASLDGSVSIFTKDGVRLFIMTQDPCAGVAFDLFRPDRIAISCKSGRIYLWDWRLSAGVGHRSQQQSPKSARLGARESHLDDPGVKTCCGAAPTDNTFGHTAKAYGVKFSPLIQNTMMTISDDHTARVWTLTEGATPEAPVVLSGHTSRVRSQAWHPSIPHVCMTGSWDKMIKTWDARSGTCIHTSRVHLADVYAIATHNARPFMAVTCSRDTTIRFWSTEEMCPSAKLRAVLGMDVTKAGTTSANGVPRNGAGENGDDAGVRLALTGDAITHTMRQRMVSAKTNCERNAAAFTVLSGEVGAEEMWKLATIETQGTAAARVDEPSGITVPHKCEARALAGASAAALETTAGGRKGAVGSSRENTLRQAAAYRLQLGHVDTYCEIMKELGDWDAALAAAPAVSTAFWRKIARERAAALAAAGSEFDKLINLQLATGQAADAATALREAGRDDEAFTVACTIGDGGFGDAGADDPPRDPPRQPGHSRMSSHADIPPAMSHSRQSSFGGGNDVGMMSPGREQMLEPLGEIGSISPHPLSPGPLSPMNGAGRHSRQSSIDSISAMPKLPPLTKGKLAPLPPLVVKQPLRKSNSSNMGSMGAFAPPDAQPGRHSEPPPTSALAGLNVNVSGDGDSNDPSPSTDAGFTPGARLAAEIPAGDEARHVRAAQAERKLAHGDAVGAASCHLSVGDAYSAVKALVRGAQTEMAAALMLSVPGAGSEDDARSLLAEKASAIGEWDLARDVAGGIGNPDHRAWRLLLVRGRYAAVETNAMALERFNRACEELVLDGNPGTDAGENAAQRCIAGDVEGAANLAVMAANDELRKNERTGGGAMNTDALPRILNALDLVSFGRNAAVSIDPRTRAEVTLMRCYLSALVLASTGYTPAACALFHHARASLKSFSNSLSVDGDGAGASTPYKPAFPHSVAFISLQELTHMAGTYPSDARDGLNEIVKAASTVDASVRDAAKKLMNDLEGVKDEAPIPSAAAVVTLPGFNGTVRKHEFRSPSMEMSEALRAAAMWDAGGFTNLAAFTPPRTQQW